MFCGAASNWQLAIRGKASLSPGHVPDARQVPGIVQHEEEGRRLWPDRQSFPTWVRAACRHVRTSGSLRGLVTQKSRTDRLNMLLKQRAEQQNAKTVNGRQQDNRFAKRRVDDIRPHSGNEGRTERNQASFEVWKSTQMAGFIRTGQFGQAGMLLKQRSAGKAETAVVAKPATPYQIKPQSCKTNKR